MNNESPAPKRRRKRKGLKGSVPTPSDDRLLRLTFLHSRYWLWWLVLGLLRLVVTMPQPVRLAVGAMLGAMAWRFARERREVVFRNLELCFPEWTAEERYRVARENFRSLGIAVVELGMGWWVSDAKLDSLFEVEGREHVEAAQRAGRGVLLLTCHMTTLEVGGRMFARVAPYRALYQESPNPLISTIFRRSRRARLEDVISNNDMRGTVRALRDGAWIWFAPDQNVTFKRGGIFVPFFGVQASTTPAAARLAKRTGCLVLPYYPVRTPEGRYRLIIEPALKDFPGEDMTAATARINGVIERWARAHPGQYYWFHKRFKKRPKGEPGVY